MMFFVLSKNGDLDLYPSQQAAEAGLESPDVEAGEYLRAFDEHGRVFFIGSEPHRRVWFGVHAGRAKLSASAEHGAEELVELLRRRLPGELDQASLDLLVKKAAERAALTGRRL